MVDVEWAAHGGGVQSGPSGEPLEDGLITLSTLPSSRWLNLSRLDEVRERNKPIEPPKAPENAPFFLPTVSRKPHAPTPLLSLSAPPKISHVALLALCSSADSKPTYSSIWRAWPRSESKRRRKRRPVSSGVESWPLANSARDGKLCCKMATRMEIVSALANYVELFSSG